MAESSKGEYGPILTSRGEYEKILQAHGLNTRKYWLVEVIEKGCIVTRVRVYDEILPEALGNPSGSGNISSYTSPLVTIQLQYTDVASSRVMLHSFYLITPHFIMHPLRPEGPRCCPGRDNSGVALVFMY